MAAVAPPRGLAPNSSLPAKVSQISPNQTLYVTNLPSAKIQKNDLRTELYLLFSTYGPVLDIVAMKTMKMRGQAHITFRDIQAATQAMRSLEGFEFLGRPLSIQYAKSKSDFVAKLDGTYKMPNSTAGASNIEVTELQQSIFNAPAPGEAAAASKPAPSGDQPMSDAQAADRGQKRQRDEEEDDDSDVAMEEDSDDD
ncbi:U2 small nuclear ribonucleoprotein B'' [Colletotrichum aenigma]|uniref:U2 small nuclear ribonucleoprotein B'' n=1 Tax=Colletotrichum aenigma TaxID=1215731 RepID=UPI00187257DC|nr:U2 small nuclear ribonucleoprotein B'' [Colletotrichum aenigma]KAF4921176.1 U2 small nuclear ribonucleoprotein B'' [Colletotrichum viniferum]KAF5527453.1 U2 small nuclear ribonucleoprotein B'' [Colletotrichum aenigma]KAI8266886.1 U2 small nuclear ribonucleoprotein B'' [Colletotrichum sp. SAR 10_98]